jgi:putative transposase
MSISDPPLDLVAAQSTVERPNQLWVADFTYVATWRRLAYAAFVIDVLGPDIGQRAHPTMRSEPVFDSLQPGSTKSARPTGAYPP